MARKTNDILIKSVSQDVKEIRRKSKELLKRANKSIREYRHELALLKKQQVVAKYIDIRKQRPTRYMLSKIRKFKDVLENKSIAVRAPKSIREKYESKGIFETRRSFIIVPKRHEKQKSKISRGLIMNIKPLKNGEVEEIILPYVATDLEQLAYMIEDNQSEINQMKMPTEQFGFQLYGHNSRRGFPNANTPEGLSTYILGNYQHLFDKKNVLENIILFRYKYNNARPPEFEPLHGDAKVYHIKRNDDRDPRWRWAMDKRREREAQRKARQRIAETEEQRQKRLEKQKVRSARNRQRKWENE